MLFNSFTFWAFYTVVLILYWLLPFTLQNRMLLVASYVFYGAWDWRFLFLILFVTTVDFFAAQQVYNAKTEKQKKLFLALSITADLSVLGFFKYYNFFAESLNSLLNTIGLGIGMPVLNIILPVGISFFTFQSMSYTIDVYRKELKPIKNFADYALYVSFFPQLVAGPIERGSRLIPQVIHPRKWKMEYFLEGLYLIIIGLFTKIVIADNLASIVDTVYKMNAADLNGGRVLAGVYAFSFQIYGDFAGYSTIARGVARWMGVDLMVNFRNPYLAISPRDFWRRWHISLSSWFRDYVYIPLGGNRKGKWRTYFNLFATMMLSGLWHGANWTFVMWGFIHGIVAAVHRFFADDLFKKRIKVRSLTFRIIAIILMFQIVSLAWLFFRSQTISQAFYFLKLVFTDFRLDHFTISALSMVGFYVIPLLIYEIWTEKYGLLGITKKGAVWQIILYSYFILMLILFPSPTRHVFIYFRF